MTMFDNSHQLSSGVKDIGKRPDWDDADALCVGQRNCCMNLVSVLVCGFVQLFLKVSFKYDAGDIIKGF